MNYRAITISLILLLSSIVTASAQELLYKSGQSDTPKKEQKSPEKPFKRIQEVGGEVIIDGSIRVLESNYIKIIDLVEISTPVAPASGHARIWLNSSDGDLRILFSNGTARTIAAN